MLDQELLSELKAKLLEEKERVEKTLNTHADKDHGDFKAKYEDIGDDMEENAQEVQEYDTNIGVVEDLESRLKDIKDALAKMDAGTYGVCELNPANHIEKDRLFANPAARFAMKSQDDQEKKDSVEHDLEGLMNGDDLM